MDNYFFFSTLPLLLTAQKFKQEKEEAKPRGQRERRGVSPSQLRGVSHVMLAAASVVTYVTSEKDITMRLAKPWALPNFM